MVAADAEAEREETLGVSPDEAASPVTEGLPPRQQWVIETAIECVHEDNHYTSRDRLKSEAEKLPDGVLTKQEVDDVLDGLDEENRIVTWFGLVAPPTHEALARCAEDEAQAEFTRSVLLGKINAVRQTVRDAE